MNGAEGVEAARAGRGGWLVALAVAGGVLVLRGAMVAWTGESGYAPPATRAVDALVPAAVALLMAHAAWRLRARSRRLARAWGLLASAYTAYAAAEVSGSLTDSAFGTPPGSWVPFSLYLVFFPLLLLGVVALPAAPLGRSERVPLLLDMGLVVLGTSLALWTLLIAPAVAQRLHQPLRLAMTVAAPAGDLVVLWALLTLLLRRKEPALVPIYGLLVAATAFMFVTDLFYAYHLLWTDPWLWRHLGPGWTASHALAGLAAVRQLLSVGAVAESAGAPRPQAPLRRSRASLYLAYASLTLAVLVFAVSHRSQLGLLGTLAVLAVIGLALARKVFGMAESERLREALLTANETLEERVEERTAELGQANLALAAEVGERRRAEERIRRELARLEALREIDRAIAGSFDLSVTLNVFLANVTAQLGVDAAAVRLLDPVSQTLELHSRRGFRGEARGDDRFPIGEGIAGLAALERRVVSVSGLAAGSDALARSRVAPDEDFLACHAAPLVVRGQVKGVLEVFLRSARGVDREWLDFLSILAGQGAIAVDNTSLFERTQRSNVELARAYDSTLMGWSLALELRDQETRGHSERVTERTVRLARAAGMSDDELVHVRRGALLHDIGKMAIPDSILLKPGPLSDAEWDVMRRHPVHAFELLSHVAYLRPALDIPFCHHEHWDGSGYPRGLEGAGIPLAARLFSVVDTWDALAFARPYRGAWPPDRVRRHLEEQAGSLLDPGAVRLFLAACA